MMKTFGIMKTFLNSKPHIFITLIEKTKQNKTKQNKQKQSKQKQNKTKQNKNKQTNKKPPLFKYLRTTMLLT